MATLAARLPQRRRDSALARDRHAVLLFDHEHEVLPVDTRRGDERHRETRRFAPDDAGAQAELCFANVAAILGEAGLGLPDIVRINAFVTDRAHMRPYMTVRDRLFADPAPASTLMIVSGFTRPEFKVEIEVIAAGRS